MKRIAIDERTVERLERASCTVLVAGLALAALCWPLVLLGMDRAALACLALGLGGVYALGLVVALVAAVVELLVWRRGRASR